MCPLQVKENILQGAHGQPKTDEEVFTAAKKAKREKSTKASINSSHHGGSDDNGQTFERFQMPNILSPVQKQSKKEKEQAALRRAVAPKVEDPKLQLKE